MKVLLTLLSAAAILTTSVLAETPVAVKEQVQSQVKNETQNRFQKMSTDELLEKRGTMTNQQEREHLHNELKMREQLMSKEQKEKFNKRPPENRTPKMKNQSQGQGDGMGGGKGGR